MYQSGIITVKAQSIAPFILSVHCLVTQCIVYNEACKKMYYSGEGTKYSTFHFVGALSGYTVYSV